MSCSIFCDTLEGPARFLYQEPFQTYMTCRQLSLRGSGCLFCLIEHFFGSHKLRQITIYLTCVFECFGTWTLCFLYPWSHGRHFSDHPSTVFKWRDQHQKDWFSWSASSFAWPFVVCSNLKFIAIGGYNQRSFWGGGRTRPQKKLFNFNPVGLPFDSKDFGRPGVQAYINRWLDPCKDLLRSSERHAWTQILLRAETRWARGHKSKKKRAAREK